MRGTMIIATILLLAGSGLFAQAVVPDKITTPEEAKACLLQAYQLQYTVTPHLDQAISLMKKVVEYDPSFEANYLDASVHMFAMSRLGWAYWDARDYAKALEAFTLGESLFRKKHPDRGETDLTSAIAECRRRLANENQRNSAPGQIETVDEARILLRQAYYADRLGTPDSHVLAIAMAKKVASFDAGLEARFPEERIGLGAAGELGHLYDRTDDHGRAMQAFTVWAEFAERDHPDKQYESMLPYMIEDSRKKAAEAGQHDWPPMIVSDDGPSLPEGSVLDGDVLTAPAGEIGRLLKLDVHNDKARGSVTLSARGAGAKSVVLLPGARNAVANGKALVLPAVPKKQGDDLVIPVRAVAEYFGASVKWDPVARIAWLQ